MKGLTHWMVFRMLNAFYFFTLLIPEVTVLGLNPDGGMQFSAPVAHPASLLYDGYRLSFLGVKRPGRGVDHPPTIYRRG